MSKQWSPEASINLQVNELRAAIGKAAKTDESGIKRLGFGVAAGAFTYDEQPFSFAQTPTTTKAIWIELTDQGKTDAELNVKQGEQLPTITTTEYGPRQWRRLGRRPVLEVSERPASAEDIQALTFAVRGHLGTQAARRAVQR